VEIHAESGNPEGFSPLRPDELTAASNVVGGWGRKGENRKRMPTRSILDGRYTNAPPKTKTATSPFRWGNALWTGIVTKKGGMGGKRGEKFHDGISLKSSAAGREKKRHQQAKEPQKSQKKTIPTKGNNREGKRAEVTEKKPLRERKSGREVAG